MKKIKVILGLFIAVLITVLMVFFVQNNRVYTSSNFVMDTIVNLDITGKDSSKCGQEIIACLNQFEQSFSMYKENSDIYTINENAGENFVKVDDKTYSLLKRAYNFCDKSSGRFDITIAPLVTAWDIKSENPSIPKVTDELLSKIDYTNILFDDSTKGVMLKEKGQMLDLGAIAKGAVCDDVYRILEQNNVKKATVSVGGNIVLYGKDTSEVKVGIKHPRSNTDAIIGTVNSDKRIIATTGDYERYFELDGKRYHHILDTKSGYPFESEFYSVTVMSDDGALCDYLSTMMFMMSKQELLDLRDRQDFYFVAVGKDGNIYKSNNINFTVLDSEYKIYEW